MEKDKIKEMLEYRFNLVTEHPKKRHIIFWYDEDKAFTDIIEDLKLENVKIIVLKKEKNRKGELIDTNIFKTKYILEYEDLESNYLIYSEYPKPNDRENFLIDIEKYSEFFMADKSAMIIEELKLDRTDYNLTQVVKKHLDFFKSKDRREKLAKILETPEKITEKDLKLGILSIAVNSKSMDIQEILKNIILDRSKLENIEKWIGKDFLYSQIKDKFNIEINDFDKLLKILLVVNFYRELQEKPHVNLENYYCGKTNDIYIFVSSLLHNNQIEREIKEIFENLGEELNIKERILELDIDVLVQGISFEEFDKLIIKYLAESLNSETLNYEKYKKYIEIRLDNSLWREKYINYYKALLSITNLFNLKENLIIKDRESMNEIFNDYIKEYYKIDKYYREFYYYFDLTKNTGSFEELDQLEEKISYFYEKYYLEKLLEIWAKKLSLREYLPYQKDFYKNYISQSDTRTAVIISDALRYEVADELVEKLRKEVNSKEIELKGMITNLPSITSVGMTNLLPNKDRVIDPFNKKFSISGINTLTTENREKILKLVKEESSAISLNDFKNLSRAEQDEYVKGKKVIYIYHDSIDSIGDKAKTENKTFEACKMAIEDITGMTKILSSLGIVTIYITSDHGFLYERKEVEEYNKLELSKEYEVIGKRYALSKQETKEKGCVTLKLNDDYYGIFPEKNQRIKTSGSGLQFIHGGISPQEMIIPLIYYKSGTKSKKSSKVKVRIKESSGKLTSNLSKFTVYQLDAVDIRNKVIERDIVAGLYDGDVRVSNEVKIRLNSNEENFQHDFRLTLSGEHKKVTLKIIDLETGDILDSKEYKVNIGIVSDFTF